MDKLFLDANIFFAASCSKTGGSRMLFELARLNKVRLYSSVYAGKEAQINVQRKLGTEAFIECLNLMSLLRKVEKKKISEDFGQQYRDVIVAKDLPILFGAFSQNVDYLVTLDRKDFMTKKVASAGFDFKIVTPGEYLQSL
jgi:predicted nucleic acid-binding protein